MSLKTVRQIAKRVDANATACSKRIEGDDGDAAQWFEVRTTEFDFLAKSGLSGRYVDNEGTRYDWRYIFEINA